MILNGTEKSALLLMSIGPDQAAKILKHLTPFEVQQLITAMVNMNQFSTKILTQILRECYNLSKDTSTVSCNSDDYLSVMLTKALGEKRGNDFLKEALESRDIKICLDALNFINPNKVAGLLEKEHPQLISTILVHLDKNQAARILLFFNDEKRSDIILRIAEFTGIEENSVLELRKVINHLLKNKKLVLSEKDGIKMAASILNSIPRSFEERTINNMRKRNKKLVSEIVKEMYLFENIIDLSDQCIQSVINTIEHEKLYIALQNSDISIREKFFKNMTEEMAYNFRISLEKKSYFSDIAIKNEQKLILMVIKKIVEDEKKTKELG